MTSGTEHEILQNVESLSDLNKLIETVTEAQRAYATFSQEQVDEIFKAAAIAAGEASVELAKMAVAETGMGVFGDKVTKNNFASKVIYDKYKNEKTCGVISQNEARNAKTIAAPIGLIVGIIPTTNPTATAIFKTLLALKTRNAVIITPHPRASKCTVAAAKIVLEAATKAHAPSNIIGWLDTPTMELSNALMQHPSTSMILATGGPGMVKAAYSSGKPAIGVGSGNTPAIIDTTANIAEAVSFVIASKTFDNGMICASEQSIIAVGAAYETVKTELISRGAHILSGEESSKLGKVILGEKGVNPAIVGQSAQTIGKLAGIDIPSNVKVLVSEEESYATENPKSREKLSPILSLYGARDFEHAVDIGFKLVTIGGLGHTSVLHINREEKQKIDYFAMKIPTGRILINVPASQAAIGLYNDYVTPSLTLGCGSWGGNSISENIGAKHLLNYKTVAENSGHVLKF
jgi:acetaldehyde dehydrogenase/alcohol dehydrogenase